MAAFLAMMLGCFYIWRYRSSEWIQPYRLYLGMSNLLLASAMASLVVVMHNHRAAEDARLWNEVQSVKSHLHSLEARLIHEGPDPQAKQALQDIQEIEAKIVKDSVGSPILPKAPWIAIALASIAGMIVLVIPIKRSLFRPHLCPVQR